MIITLHKKDGGNDITDGVTVKERLRAWWNGDILPEQPASGRRKKKTSVQPAIDGTGTAKPAPSTAAGEHRWSESRRQLAQEVWSHGFVVPGGSDYVEKLVSGCSLTAAETMLQIGVGMGGATRTIINKFGNYVTGYERDADLAAAAMRHAVTYEFDDKLDITAQPYEELSLRSGYFRAALMRDILYTIEDKAGVISKLSNSLKTGQSYLIMTDFLFEDDDESEELAAWKRVEDRPVYPWTESAMLKAIEGAGIRPRIVDDESDDYCAMVVQAWSDYMKTIDNAEISPEMGREMEREGEFWARRVAAIKAGALRYYRIEAVKVT